MAGTFPITEARQELAVTPTRAVRANIDTRTAAGAVGAAIGQGILAGAREVQKGAQKESVKKEAIRAQNRKNLDVLSSKQADNRRTQMKNDIAVMKIGTAPENWEEETVKIVTQGNTDISGFDFSPEAMAEQQIVSQGDLQSLPDESFISASRVISKATITIAEESLTDDYREGRKDIAQRKIQFVARMKENGVSAPDIILKLRAAEEAGKALRAGDAIENIKPALIEAIETVDKEEGIKTLDLATDQLVESGILTKTEGAQANKVLGDWIDNFVAGREKLAKDAVKLTTTETYADLSGKIVSGTLTFQDIDESSLLKADKDKWRIYIKGSYKDAPKETTQAGLLDAAIAVFDAATLQLSPTEAADILLEARFVDQSITNDQFNWGLDKIKNPYPRQILEDLRATFNSNNEDFNRIFKADRERNKNVNEALIAWVDDLIAKDKVPAFDFKKKMHAMSSQFRVGNARWYDIGQIIQRGGRNWEVIGFDENGEPLVDEVQ